MVRHDMARHGLRLLLASSVTLPALLPGALRAADLQPPRTMTVSGLIPNPRTGPGCPATAATQHRDYGQLVVRDAPRPDVGPYTVSLPGYGQDKSPGHDDKYRPFLIETQPGHTLRIDLVNQLPAGSDDINLHTHGLIVDPRRCAPPGDSVYVTDPPNKTLKYEIPIPAKLPGAMFAGGGQDRPYPPGINWFHAHVHGTAKPDVMAGQSGILQIGDLRPYLLALPNLAAATRQTVQRTDVVYLGLRDIQLSVPKGSRPDMPSSAGQHADWLKDQYDPGACPGRANPRQDPLPGSFDGRGYCGHENAGSQQDILWLFTVNGQYDPTIRQKPGRNQLWRIANLSTDVSYVLELVADSDPNTPLPMNVVSLDGLIAGTSPPGSPDLHVGVSLKHLLLMPAGRAEVFVPAGIAEGGPLTLKTGGITTGSQGDPWPELALAHVAGPPASPHLMAQTVPAQQRAAALASTVSFDITIPGGAPGGAPQPQLDLLRQRNAPAAVQPLAAQLQPPQNCVVLPPGQDVRRRITFSSNDTGFMLGSEVVTSAGANIDPPGTPGDKSHNIGPAVFPMEAMHAPESVRHVCPRFGELEVWELVNTTGELHNFHIHQSKFRLSVPSDPGVPQGSLDPHDPTGIIAHYVPEAEGAKPDAKVDVWHDTLPVPPAKSADDPGRVFVTIPFLSRHQVGFFVYHCHILEHEDGGMMAVVQVFDPAHPNVAALDAPQPTDAVSVGQLALGSICRLPANP